MEPHQVLESRRRELGLSQDDVAARSGLTVHEYPHLEEDPTELYMVTLLEDVERVCAALRIDIVTLYGLPLCSEPVTPEFLAVKRQGLGLSRVEVANRVGIEEDMLEVAESDISAIGGWVMEPVRRLANVLGVSPACLVSRIAV
jgi:transcriptional regulator with XRE-family HTH domain